MYLNPLSLLFFFAANITPSLASATPSNWLWCPFNMNPVIFNSFLVFHIGQDIPDTFCAFPGAELVSATSPRSPTLSKPYTLNTNHTYKTV